MPQNIKSGHLSVSLWAQFKCFSWNFLHFLRSLECNYVTAIISKPINSTEIEPLGIIGWASQIRNAPKSETIWVPHDTLRKCSPEHLKKKIKNPKHFWSQVFQIRDTEPPGPQNHPVSWAKQAYRPLSPPVFSFFFFLKIRNMSLFPTCLPQRPTAPK